MITDSSAKTTRSEVTAGNDKAWNADALAGLAAYARSQRTTGLFAVHRVKNKAGGDDKIYFEIPADSLIGEQHRSDGERS